MAQQKIVQTAGRTQLGEFAPEFAHLNDDILFAYQPRNHRQFAEISLAAGRGWYQEEGKPAQEIYYL